MRTLGKRVERIEEKIPKSIRDSRPIIYVEDLTDQELDAAIKGFENGVDPYEGFQLINRDPRVNADLESMTDAELDAAIEELEEN